MKNVILSLLILAALFVVTMYFTRPVTKQATIIVDSKVKITVEIADTEEKRAQGLSNREKLGENEGMLFVFDGPGFYRFWMKDMKFDLDFIWIANGRVVDITENVSHNNQKTLYFSKVPLNMILEVNAGFAGKNGVEIGNNIKIINN